MALSSFAFTGGANVAVGPTPLAVQIAGTTLLVANVGTNTVYGSVGGSASTTLSPTTYITGQAVNTSGGGNTSTGVGGWAVLPGQSVVIASSGQTWLWLATLAGSSAVNVANGT